MVPLSGTSGKFGSDVLLRGVVEAAICEKFSPDFGQDSEEKMTLPMICICVEGGPNTLATCLAALQQGNCRITANNQVFYFFLGSPESFCIAD